jgi:methionyl-tRNA formyltransferase
MDRLIIFTDFTSPFVPLLLTKTTLHAVNQRRDVEIAGICVNNPQKYHQLVFRYFQTVIKRKIRFLFDPHEKQSSATPLPINIEKLAHHYGFSILPPAKNINQPAFIKHLKTMLRPTIALAYFYPQKFSPELLEVLGPTVNYHNSLLPKYKGLKATGWSVYHGEKETGYTFHFMNKSFDEGNILLQGGVTIKPDASLIDLELQKALKASHDIPHLLELLINRARGKTQAGESSYFSEKDFLEIRKIDDSSAHSSVELLRRLRAFGLLIMNINGTWHEVTKLVTIPAPLNTRRKLAFRANDGVIMEATRFHYVPLLLYRVLRGTVWRFPSK